MRQAHGLKSRELLNKKWYLNISLLATILQKCMKIYFKKEKKRVYWPKYTKKLENDGIDKGEKKSVFMKYVDQYLKFQQYLTLWYNWYFWEKTWISLSFTQVWCCLQLWHSDAKINH